jgi:hypothetical protein
MNDIKTINTIEVPFEIIRLDDQHNVHPVVEAYIDRLPVRLVVDTGASHSCLSKQLIKHLPGITGVKADVVLGIGRGKLNNQLVSIPHIAIGALTIENYSFLSLKISHINKMLSHLSIDPIHGLLGSDILYLYKADMNYATQKIIFQQLDATEKHSL